MQAVFRQALKNCNSARVQYNSVSRSTTIPIPVSQEKLRRRRFEVGQELPIAHTQTLQYPEDYRPWTVNYTGNGFLVGATLLMYFAYFQYNAYYLQRSEMSERPKDRQYYQP